MASVFMHEAAAREICRRCGIRDPERFCFGAILPDACRKGEKELTHYAKRLKDGKKIIRLSEFRKLYWETMFVDDLILGYYIHLVQDVVSRPRLYREFNSSLDPDVRSAALYKDYTASNYILKDLYELPETLAVPDNIDFIEGFRFRPEEVMKVYDESWQTPQGCRWGVFSEGKILALVRDLTFISIAELDSLKESSDSTINEYKYSW